MKRSAFWNLILLAILMANVYVLIFYSKRNESIIERIVPIQDHLVRDMILQLLESQNLEIIDSVYFSTTCNSNYSITDLTGGSNTWFLYLPSTSCHNCLSSILADIEFHWGSEILNDIIFYTSFNDSLSVVEIENDFKIQVFNLKNNYLGISHERRQEYFIFCLDETKRIKYFFPLNQDRSQWNNLFFRFIGTRIT
ncbi:MAG: hypothetical protein Q8J88_02615 [Bacteroidales bacterium]|nr:hypothetical protein [Bacteroidales bacterium]